MNVLGDLQLLERWAQHGADEAFAELVQRHVSLVWGTARRITGDPDVARDVAQTVFSDLAHKASVLPPATFLPGWLHRATVHAARNCVRSNTRRQEREQRAMNQPDTTPDLAEAQAVATLQPLLDDALATLPDADRDAVLQRYFGGKSYGEIGAALGASDDTAQKRVSRALERLRDHFRQRGIAVAAGSVAASLTVAAGSPVPAGVAGGITAAILGTTAVTAPAFALFSMKTLLASLTVATGVLAVVSVRQHQQVKSLAEANAALTQQLTQAATPAPPPAEPNAGKLSEAMLTELLQLRAEVARRKKETPKVQANQVVQLQAQVAAQAAQLEQVQAAAEYKKLIIQRVNALKMLGLAARVYAVDNGDRLPTTFEMMRTEMSLDAEGHMPGGLSPDDFEFFPQPRPVSETEPQLILFREKKVLENPAGGATHVYCLADGSVQQVSGSRVAEFEREGTATGAPPAPAQPEPDK